MPKTLTIHELEPTTARLLMVYARRQSKSLNQSVKDLLAVALGVVSKPRMKVDNGLSRFRGCVMNGLDEGRRKAESCSVDAWKSSLTRRR